MAVVFLSKPQLVLIAPVLAFAGVRAGSVALAVRRLAVYGAVVGALAAPWILRNYVVFRAFVPGVTQGGMTFWGGSGPLDGETVGSVWEPHVPSEIRERVRGMGERERDRWLYAEGLRNVRERPWNFARLAFLKVPRLWFNLGFGTPPSTASWVIAALNLGLLGLAAFGLRDCAGGPGPVARDVLVGTIAVFTLVHMAFYAVVRYAFPALALVMAFAGAGAVRLARRVGVSRAAGRR
jgi:hypothetical protein